MDITITMVVGHDAENKEITNPCTFSAPNPKGRMVRKAFEIIENVDMSNMKTSDLDNMVNYIVELYGNQFTLDDVYDGIPATDLLPTLIKCIKDVSNKVGEKLDKFPKN